MISGLDGSSLDYQLCPYYSISTFCFFRTGITWDEMFRDVNQVMECPSALRKPDHSKHIYFLKSATEGYYVEIQLNILVFSRGQLLYKTLWRMLIWYMESDHESGNIEIPALFLTLEFRTTNLLISITSSDMVRQKNGMFKLQLESVAAFWELEPAMG